MAAQDGGGSIIFKLVIILLVVATIIVIEVPGSIWQEEEMIMNTSRGNLATLYEAHRYFHGLKGYYATSDEELVATVQNDSALIKRQLVVNHTKRLKVAMEEFLNVPLIKNFNSISSNIKNIEDDLNANKRFFRTIEEIDLEAEDLKMQLSGFRSGIDFEKYSSAVVDLDSMWQLRHDLTDYSLQSAARLASSFARDISKEIQLIDFNVINQYWQPLNKRIEDLMNAVNKTKLKSLTSVSDRVGDFQRDASDALNFMLTNKTSASYNEANRSAEELMSVYREFLSDFLITQEYAQHTLSETDSLLINISEASFFTPKENQHYTINFNDTLGIRVEDPTLLEDLKSAANQEVGRISQLPFVSAFDNYQKQIKSLKEFYPQIKARYRRNIDITILSKELEFALDKIPESAAFNAYMNINSFVKVVPESDSYSEIKENIESALVSLGTFRQIFEDNFFGNLDTVHIEVIEQLNEFNQTLSKIRRNQFSFDSNIDDLNSALSQIKSIPKESVLPALQQIEENMRELYLFASEGKEKSVYGIFSTRIINYGKIYGTTGQKSWEE